MRELNTVIHSKKRFTRFCLSTTHIPPASQNGMEAQHARAMYRNLVNLVSEMTVLWSAWRVRYFTHSRRNVPNFCHLVAKPWKFWSLGVSDMISLMVQQRDEKLFNECEREARSPFATIICCKKRITRVRYLNLGLCFFSFKSCVISAVCMNNLA